MTEGPIEKYDGYPNHVRKSDLRELVGEWRASAHETKEKTVRQGRLLHHLADELEELIDDEE